MRRVFSSNVVESLDEAWWRSSRHDFADTAAHGVVGAGLDVANRVGVNQPLQLQKHLQLKRFFALVGAELQHQLEHAVQVLDAQPGHPPERYVELRMASRRPSEQASDTAPHPEQARGSPACPYERSRK